MAHLEGPPSRATRVSVKRRSGQDHRRRLGRLTTVAWHRALKFLVKGPRAGHPRALVAPASFICQSQTANAYGVHEAYIHLGGLVMVYAAHAILAILAIPETKHVDLEG